MEVDRFEELKGEVLSNGTLAVTVYGANGEQIVSASVEALNDANLPDTITSIEFDSATALRPYNVTPLNRFTLRLDFSEPPGFNSYNPWNQPTPNRSQIEVIGNDDTWVTAVFSSTLSFFRQRQRWRGWLHSHVAFNVLNWLVGFPGALWITYRLDSSRLGVMNAMHTALRGALYVYVFLLGLLVFRGIVWGFRWIFPLVELDGARSKKVRGALGVVLSSLLLALLYDVLRAVLR